MLHGMTRRYKRIVFCLLCALVWTGNVKGQNIEAEALVNRADSLYGVQQYQEALQTAKQALPLTKGQEIEADCLNLLAIINIRLSDYDEAAKYAKECYLLDEKTGDPDVMSSSLNTLAAIYMGANRLKEAEEYVLRGIEQAKKANNPGRMAVLQAMASEVYHAQGNDQEALTHIDEAYRIDSTSGNEPRAMIRLAQKGSVLIGLHRYAEAEQVLKKVIPFLQQMGDRQSLGIACNKLGMALLSQKREQDAIPYYQQACDIFVELGDIYNEVHARRGLYESLWKSDPDEAKKHLDRFNDLKDSIYTHTSADKLAKYSAEFGNDWLQLENHAQRKAKMWAIAIAVFALLLAVVIWLFMRYRQRQQQRQNQELQQRIQELLEKYNQLSDSINTTESTAADNEKLTQGDREFLERTINTINELIMKGQIDAQHVAEEMGMSLFQLRQRLGALIDETPQSFIQSIRMQRARHLLETHPEMTVSEIATLCAYNDTPNFTRAFKKTFGVTPTQFSDSGARPQ